MPTGLRFAPGLNNLRGLLPFAAILLPLVAAYAQPTVIEQPVGTSAAVGATVQFYVTASGVAPLAYQWLKVGTNLVNGAASGRATVAGATTNTLTLTGITTNDESSYSCRVTNTSGSVTSSIASLIVIVSPSITTQPLSYNTNAGATVRFSVLAGGTAPLTYQWEENGSPLSGATLNSYTLSGLTTNDAGTYSVIVSNAAGRATSSGAVLNVGIAPAITGQPGSLTVTQGQSASFSVTATGTPLNYFWRKNGVFIPGATSALLAFGSVVPTNAATYTCQVSNFVSSVGSAGAVLTVDYPPTITVQPVGQTIGVGSNFTVSVTASGVPALAYQWRTNGTAIAGATAASYTVTGAQTNNAGSYDVVITNLLGAVTSSVANISVVYYSPTIVTQPVGGNVPVGNTFTFSASATGTAPLTWQWRDNGTPISGANTNSYVLGPVQLTDAGSYDVVVANIAGSITSSVAVVNVGYVPVIVQQPQSLTNTVGGTANFSCLATGTAPVNLQWTLNGYAIAGATNASLALTNLQPANIGYYALTATNLFGGTVSSNAALNLNGYNFSQWAGLEAYYPLNGNANDASGNGNDGTNFGAVAASDRFGNANGAMSFNGSGNYIRCKSGAYFGSRFTVSAWVNATAYNNYSRILDFGNGGPSNNTDMALTSGTSGKPYFEAYVGTTQVADCGSPNVIPLNTWVYVVGVCDGTQISLYFNGIKQAQTSVTVTRQPVTTTLNYIGKSNWSGDLYFAGRFDDIRIFNRALATNEVAQLYALESQSTLMPPQHLSGSLDGGSNLDLTLTGQPGGSYVLQTATDLAAPIPWQSLVTNTADVNGVCLFTDTNLNSARKFYRATTP